MNILIIGVGGQGTLLASKVIGQVAAGSGYDVKVSEVHGMAQRGGSVETYVRFSKERVYSPILDLGGADIILACELLEAYRGLPYLKRGGRIIANTQRLDPMPVLTGAAAYPEDITGKLRRAGVSVTAVDAYEAAVSSGGDKVVNVVLMGVLSGFMDFTEREWTEAISESVPPKFLDMNLTAFEAGRRLKRELD